MTTTYSHLTSTSTLPPATAPPQELEISRIIYCIIMFMISAAGIFANILCFCRMYNKDRYRTIFHLLNRTRMLSNTVILIVFLFWVIPCTAINKTYLPHIFNQVFGQLAGWGAYWMGPTTQTFISITRFIAAYFPFFYRTIERRAVAAGLILVCLIYCSFLFAIGIPDGCSFEYVPSIISFLPIGDCAMGFNTFINVGFTVFFVITTILNLFTAIRILHVIKQVRTINDSAAVERERRNWRLLVQNTIENFLYVFDVYIINIQVSWYNENWYQFIINTATWQAHVMIDGFIVMAYNKNLIKGTLSPSGTWARQSTTTRVSTTR